MEKTKIGFDAGKIWQMLMEKGELKATDLKKMSKMDIKDVYMALGWLAREGKVHFFQLENEFAVCLSD